MNPITTLFRHLIAHRRHRSWAFLPVLFCLSHNGAQAEGLTPPEVLIGSTEGFLEFKVEEYLQNSGIEGRYEIQVSRLDPRLRLATCDRDLTVSLESPAQPIGRVTVKVRCEGSTPWSVFVPAQVRLFRNVIVAARPMRKGEELSSRDYNLVERDVGLLSQGYLTAPSQAEGYKLTRPVLVDQILTPTHVEMAEVVHKGDQVVISAGSSTVQVKMPGEALSAGAIGDQIRVRNLNSKRVVKARVTGPGQVEVAM
ncbi:flagellar basal body P-ring formation chaperone FlgA [Metapseudomonas otitidis]|uniref:flagellar basal body P-ring formation chaperone FlgA n=1 Tax=Metapseudomonas otitidis TaxID=319939 RepID=UPI001AAF4A02|nr:flagellar basal body P-ring formation chaperone FlgA [Pseudomonas otitidis]MBO2927453.1 flagellar basal body P-ring formation protein FlgA [Pseudomonas otitidis]WIF70330.1 flagellar basal body P-ring formation chaperone FlgA [Pseudomonas otitidis]